MSKRPLQFAREAKIRKQRIIKMCLVWAAVLGGGGWFLYHLHQHGQMSIAGVMTTLGLGHG